MIIMRILQQGCCFCQMVTLFSAPNYCGEFDNAGAVMIVSKDLTCSFRILPVFCNNFTVTNNNTWMDAMIWLFLSLELQTLSATICTSV